MGMTNEDCISRQAVLDYIKSSKEWLYKNENFDIDMQTSFEDIEKFINNLPSVQPKQRVGRWIGHITNEHSREEKVGAVVYRCSPVESIECDQCRCWFLGEHLVRRSYCPNCGAKMEIEEIYKNMPKEEQNVH